MNLVLPRAVQVKWRDRQEGESAVSVFAGDDERVENVAISRLNRRPGECCLADNSRSIRS